MIFSLSVQLPLRVKLKSVVIVYLSWQKILPAVADPGRRW